jgi:hypothetical protein
MGDFLVFSTVRLLIGLLYILALVIHLLRSFGVKSKEFIQAGPSLHRRDP